MTTVSGTTPTTATTATTSSGSATAAANAQTVMKALLTSDAFLESVQNTMNESSTKTSSTTTPTAQQVLSTLMSLINPDGSKTISKTDVTMAITALGGTAANAATIWQQLSPYGLNNISASSVQGSTFMTSSVNSNMAALKSTYSTFTSSATGIAGKTMTLLLTSNDVIGALASESSTYVPPTSNQMISDVWALFDVNGTSAITESDVKTAVVAEGGTVGEAEDLWQQLSPSGGSSVNAAQMVKNSFVTSSITANTQDVQSTVAKYQLANAGTSNSVLDKFSSAGSDVLNGAASGYSDSPVGGGGYSNDLNLFA